VLVSRRNRDVTSGNTAQHLQADSEIDSLDASIFHVETEGVVDLILNVTRLEPASIAGFCGQLNISSDESYKIVSMVQGEWGGGLYKIQALKRNPNGKMGFGESRRIKIAGEPKVPAVSVKAVPQPVQPVQAPTAVPAAFSGYPGYPWPYPHPQPPQQAQAAPADPWAMMSHALELLKQMQPQVPVTTAVPTADDMAKLVRELSTTVKANAAPDDGFANLEKALKLVNQLRGKPEPAAKAADDDDDGISPIWLKLAERILAVQQPAPQQPTMRIPKPPPGYAFDPKLRQYVVIPTARPPKPPERQVRENRENNPVIEEDSADEDQDDDDENDENDEETPLKAEEAFDEFLAMDPEEQQKLLQLVLHNAENPSPVQNGH